MPDERQRIENSIDTVRGLTDQFANLTGGQVDKASEALDYHIYSLEASVNLRIATVEASIIRAMSVYYQVAVTHTLKAYWHASPGLILILAAIWAVIVVIWEIVKFIIAIVEIIQALKLDDLLAQFWPAFERARAKFRLWVADLSEAIGWGVDGLLHILHATQGFTDVIGGLTGKTLSWMDAEWMVSTGDVLEKVSLYSHQIQDRPGDILEILFQSEKRKSFRLFEKLGDELWGDIQEGAARLKRVVIDIGGIADELASIQENMPEMIRKNIPAGIWDGLESFSETIATEILPRIRIAEKQMALLDNLFASHAVRLSDLADRLAHPGTNLLGIDDLPGYVRDGEEWAIDDVSSRKFGESADAERAAMQVDLDRFALIDNAATSPIPALPFMTIEDPARAALHGIVATPQETWFIGGYKDQL